MVRALWCPSVRVCRSGMEDVMIFFLLFSEQDLGRVADWLGAGSWELGRELAVSSVLVLAAHGQSWLVVAAAGLRAISQRTSNQCRQGTASEDVGGAGRVREAEHRRL